MGEASNIRNNHNLAPSSPEAPRVGVRLAELRKKRALSLDELSQLSGVSKSMLSQIERSQANPTVTVVWRLSNALRVNIAALLAEFSETTKPAIEVVSAHATPVVSSTDRLCQLRILGDAALAGQFEWYTLDMAVGGELASEAHEQGTREHITVFAGEIEVQSDTHIQRLKVGETARYNADCKHIVRNVGTANASASMVLVRTA
jgi:XRE family transcriptional regulator, regulator of sulfur utilization